MIERKLEKIILEMLENFRVVSINGPRQSGKTTLQKLIAKNKNMDYYTFDDVDIYNTAKLDPKGFIDFISKNSSVAIDEVQMVPEVISSIKMTVDEQNKKGHFLLTGSSDMFKNSQIKESLAGRMATFNLYPLSYGEINKKDLNIIDKLFSDDFNNYKTDFEAISKKDFISAVVDGGYPEVYSLPTKAKKAWYDFYIKARIAKDIATIENVQASSLSLLTKLLRVLASQVGSLVNYSKISKDIGIADKTIAKYIDILEALYIVKLVPAYSRNIKKRVIKSPKVHFIDSGLASFLLNASLENSMLGKNKYIGSLVETFVYSELIKHKAYSKTDVEIFHYRDLTQKEVDFVLESSFGDIVAIEVKSGRNLKNENFNGLLSLAKDMKNIDFKGIVFYGGDKVLPYKLEDFQFWAIPLKVLI
ncbi:MAG: ATP-binding protein [Sulfurospirillaceae bacterium]|nr:ATP-binding protein [Sulfurospirillaceae bacterium]NLM99283.1 ATP-binding protein [Campylobacteraceae bacterium]